MPNASGAHSFSNFAIRNSPGFTLIEVLTAMMVLLIGLAGALSLVFGSMRAATAAAERNAATALIQQAIGEIQRNHLIVNPMPGVGAVAANQVGLYVETWPSGDGTWPNLRTGSFTGMQAKTPTGPNSTPETSTPGSPSNTNFTYWPTGVTYSKEVFWPPCSNPASNTAHPYYEGGPPGATPTANKFRVLYKLERHPTWINQVALSLPACAYEGVYVLTLTVYRDLDVDQSLAMSSNKKHFAQVSDPMVVYLYSKAAY